MADVSPNSLSVRSLAGKWVPGCCWLSHTSNRSWSAARTATALPPMTRMAFCTCVVRGMSQIRVHLTKTFNQFSILLGCVQTDLWVGFELSCQEMFHVVFDTKHLWQSTWSDSQQQSGGSLAATTTIKHSCVLHPAEISFLSWFVATFSARPRRYSLQPTRNLLQREKKKHWNNCSYRPRWKNTLCKGSCGGNRGKLDENMRRNIDQKEQSRRNNDVSVHHDVAIERHFSDPIRRLFANSLRKDNVNWSKLSQLIGAISQSEDLASSALHGDALEYPRSN